MPFAHIFNILSSQLQTLIVQGGYPLIGIMIFLEGIPLIGTAIPGHVTIIIAGFLARIGVLNLPLVLIISSVGAILGDYIGFYFGRRYGISFIDRLRPYFFISESQIEKARQLLSKHTGKAMIIGRFSPLTRALMPFLVGTSQTSTLKFWIFNFIGAISWVSLSVMLGYAFGYGYHAVSGYLGKGAVAALLIALIIIWGYKFINMRFHIFKKYELFVLSLNIVSLWTLFKTIQDAFSNTSFLANFDVWVNIFISNHISPTFQKISYVITNIGGTESIGFFGLSFTVYFALRHKWRSASIMLLSMVSTGFAVGIMKEFFLRARPEDAYIVMLNDPSFPSGHSAIAAAFFVVIAYLYVPKIFSWVKRELFIVFCVLAIMIIGVTRILLNVHWFSDVLAGWSVGIFFATASILFVKYAAALINKKKNVQ